MECHICGKRTKRVLDFGILPLANNYPKTPNESEIVYDGKWGWCEHCQLLQLTRPPDTRQVFTEDYPYRTSTSQSMMDHFEDTAWLLSRKYWPEYVAEIGPSDGGLITHFGSPRDVVGFEPSVECRKFLAGLGIRAYPSFNRIFALDATLSSSFDLIYSANTLRSLPNLNDVFETVSLALSSDGVFVIEEPYLPSIIANREYDQFYSECVFCLTATSVNAIANRHNMILGDVELLDTHGGSVRYHIFNGAAAQHDEVRRLMDMEKDIYFDLRDFQRELSGVIDDFRSAIYDANLNGKRVVGYGATAKSSTMLSGCNLTADDIVCVYDNSPAKIGRYTPLSHIPIIDARFFSSEPDDSICVLFAWNHAKEITSRYPNREWLVYAPEVRYL